MKKIIVSVLALFAFATTLSAQNKGDMYLGGHLGITTTSITINSIGQNTTQFSLSPEYGYFVAKNFRIGASLSYELTTNGVMMSEGNSTALHSISITPNIAYYIRIMNSFYYTPSFEIGFVCGIAGGKALPGFGLGLALGSFEFRPSTKFGLSLNILSFNYNMMSYKEEGVKFSVNGVNFSLGMTPSIGLKYYF